MWDVGCRRCVLICMPLLRVLQSKDKSPHAFLQRYQSVCSGTVSHQPNPFSQTGIGPGAGSERSKLRATTRTVASVASWETGTQGEGSVITITSTVSGTS